nr:hypothetical protein [Tanacetum cinerariifolium]
MINELRRATIYSLIEVLGPSMHFNQGRQMRKENVTRIARVAIHVHPLCFFYKLFSVNPLMRRFGGEECGKCECDGEGLGTDEICLKRKVDQVSKPYEWALDEWYYQGEYEYYLTWKAEEEQLAIYQLARDQRLRQRPINDVEHLLKVPCYNFFEHDSYDDESYYTDDDVFEALDYEEAYLAFDREKSPNFNL